MPSISVLSSCGLAVARLCYFVSMWLRSFSSLSLLDNGTKALAFVPGAGVQGMKGAQAEHCIHSNTHLWQTPGPHDSPRTTACVTKSKGFITDDRVGGIHSLNSHTCIILGSCIWLTGVCDNKRHSRLHVQKYWKILFFPTEQKACAINVGWVVGRVPIQTTDCSNLNSPRTDKIVVLKSKKRPGHVIGVCCF